MLGWRSGGAEALRNEGGADNFGEPAGARAALFSYHREIKGAEQVGRCDTVARGDVVKGAVDVLASFAGLGNKVSEFSEGRTESGREIASACGQFGLDLELDVVRGIAFEPAQGVATAIVEGFIAGPRVASASQDFFHAREVTLSDLDHVDDVVERNADRDEAAGLRELDGTRIALFF